MPHLARFLEHGVMGNLASLQPCLTPLLWTSIATGRTADEHGILGFVEARPDGLGLVPSRSTTRRTKALWNILSESGLKSCVVAWPVSDPPEPIDGVYISERALDNPAAVHPPTLAPFVADLILQPTELLPEDLRAMIPNIGAIDVTQDPRPAQLARLFARCASVHAIATTAMEAEPWDFFAVYYDAIDRAGHDFMAYRAPRMAQVSEPDFENYRHVIDGVYEFHDAMLGRLLELAGPETTVILLSDHGFQSGNLRPDPTAEAAQWHRLLGVLAMRGPGIRKDERIYGATLLDIAPTVLALFGLPVGRDMPGRVLTGAFAVPPQITEVDTWESTATPPTATATAADPQAALRQLAALGYIDPAALNDVSGAIRESRFNLATVHLFHGRPAAALPILEDLCQEASTNLRYQSSRLLALSHLGRHHELLAEIRFLETGGTPSAQWRLLAAAALAATGRHTEAREAFDRAAANQPANPVVHQVTGDYYLSRGCLPEAQRSYEQAIALDPDNASALTGLSQVHLDQGNHAEAAECALAGLQQAFWNPIGHFRLGQAMEALGHGAAAIRAYENAVAQAPALAAAHQRLADLYEGEGDYGKAAAHRAQAAIR
jgi:tetratricopeptide (TPR) repeat protein